MDYLKKSRIEEVLIAILGKGSVTSQLISRIEKILDAIRAKDSYDGIVMSEVEEILVCILLGERYEKPTHSRIAAMLKVKANGGEYTEPRKSRVEELIFEWIDGTSEIITYTGALPTTLQTVAGYLVGYKIWGNAGGVGQKTEQLFSAANSEGGYLDADGDVVSPQHANLRHTDFLPLPLVASNITVSYEGPSGTGMNAPALCFYDTEKTYLTGEPYDGARTKTFTVPENARYFRTSYRSTMTSVNIVSGTVPATSDIPYGYKLPIISNDTTTDINMGDTQLAKDEYVDSETGQIYKRTVNLWNNEFTIGYHLDQSTGLPVSYSGLTRMATLTPIDVANVDRVSFDFKNLSEMTLRVMYSLFDAEGTLLQRVAGCRAPLSFSVADAAKLYISLYGNSPPVSVSDVIDIMLVDGQTIPEQYVPYLTPTDPPVTLPQIPTAAGKTTIDYGIAALPHAAGLDGIFEYGDIDGQTWKNSVSGENDITFDTAVTDTGAEYVLPAGASGQYTSKSGKYRTAFTWYCVAKCPTTCHSAGQYMISNLGNGIGVEISSGWTAYSSVGGNHLVRGVDNRDFNSAEAVTNYALIAVSGDVNGMASIYVNGEKMTDSWNFNPVPSDRADTIFLGKRASGQLSGTDIDYKFLAFGITKQTDSDIAANSQYLMTKYLGVGRPEKVELKYETP